MSESEKLLALAEACEAEAAKWRGKPVAKGLRDAAKELRRLASQPKEQRS